MASAAENTHSASGRVKREVSIKEPDPLKRRLWPPCACLFAHQPALRNPQPAGERERVKHRQLGFQDGSFFWSLPETRRQILFLQIPICCPQTKGLSRMFKIILFGSPTLFCYRGLTKLICCPLCIFQKPHILQSRAYRKNFP